MGSQAPRTFAMRGGALQLQRASRLGLRRRVRVHRAETGLDVGNVDLQAGCRAGCTAGCRAGGAAGCRDGGTAGLHDRVQDACRAACRAACRPDRASRAEAEAEAEAARVQKRRRVGADAARRGGRAGVQTSVVDAIRRTSPCTIRSPGGTYCYCYYGTYCYCHYYYYCHCYCYCYCYCHCYYLQLLALTIPYYCYCHTATTTNYCHHSTTYHLQPTTYCLQYLLLPLARYLEEPFHLLMLPY